MDADDDGERDVGKTYRIIEIRTTFEMDTTDAQIAVLDALSAEQADALLDLYREAASLDPEEDGPAITAVWGRIEVAEIAAGLDEDGIDEEEGRRVLAGLFQVIADAENPEERGAAVAAYEAQEAAILHMTADEYAELPRPSPGVVRDGPRLRWFDAGRPPPGRGQVRSGG